MRLAPMILGSICIVWTQPSLAAQVSAPNGPGTISIDSLVGRSSGGTKPLSITSQIEDPVERRNFEGLFKSFKKSEAAERLQAAEAFVANHPRSAFLAQALEIAAKAALESGDNDAALRHGRASLELWPENPLLLVPLARVLYGSGDKAGAARYARQALTALDEFGAPPMYGDKQWTAYKSELRGQSIFILGREAAHRASAAKGADQLRAMHEADEYLSESWRLNRDDLGAGYMLGLVRQSLGRVNDAAVVFAAVASQGGPFRDKAAGRLLDLQNKYAGTPRGKNLELQAAALSAGEKPTPPLAGLTTPRSAYAGSAACKGCHAREYVAWAQSGHARMGAPYRAENVFGDFRNQTFEENGTLVARMTEDGGRHYFSVLAPPGRWLKFPVDYTIGSKWQQAYATRLSNGELQVFPLQYNKAERRWIAFWRTIDPPGKGRGFVSNFYKLNSETAYTLNCAPCHTSQLRKQPGPISAAAVEFAEPGVNCEECHGPGAEHVKSAKSGRQGAPLNIMQFGKISSKDYVAVCAVCHMQMANRDVGPEGEINYRVTDTFFPRWVADPYPSVGKRAFYRDGRFRLITFSVESMMRSQCFRRGEAHCGHCHDLHASDPVARERGLRVEFLKNPDAMCLQCHPRFSEKLEEHTHHRAAGEGSRCVNCHMPKTMVSVLFKTRTHQIDQIPNVEMTERFGQEYSPNACLICHTDRDTAWLRTWMDRWYGRRALVQTSSVR